jgi:hypothetical protein
MPPLLELQAYRGFRTFPFGVFFGWVLEKRPPPTRGTLMISDSESAARQIVEAAWRDQAVWSETANGLKKALSAWRTRAAIAGVAGALLETLAATLPDVADFRWSRALVALSGAVILAIVPYVIRTKVSKERMREWVRARSASEALKEEIYRFLVGAPPYGSSPLPAALVDRVQSEKDKVQDLNVYAAGVDPSKRERPVDLTIDGYVDQRLNDQIDRYYIPKAQENSRAGKTLHDLEFGLGLLAVAMGAIASAASATGLSGLAGLGSWVAVVTTSGAAVTAHLAASRYDHQAITYFATANRLAGLRDAWRADPDRLETARLGKFVDDSENAISSENEAWLSAWTREADRAAEG